MSVLAEGRVRARLRDERLGWLVTVGDPGYVAKYADGIVAVSGSVEAFAAAYPMAVRLDIRRVCGH